MKWEKVRLGDLCSVITKGTTPSNIGASFTDEGVKYIRSEMLTSSKYISGQFLHISSDTHEKLKRSQLKEGDILFSMAGAYLGKTAILRDIDVPANTNQAAALIRVDEQSCNREYIYYFLNIPEMIKKANTVQSQSAQPNINLKQISMLEIEVPDRDSQNRIVDILSAYDDLIENNQKQIKLLEEAAQRLYKEWFVDLHFSGYEDTEIIDGVPEGWHRSELQELSKFVRGKTITRKDVVDGDIPVVAGGLEPAYYHNKSITEAPAITVSGSGANAGFSRMYYQKIWASDCSYIDVKGTNYIYFTYCFLKENKKTLDNLQKGAAQPHVYAKDINALALKCPPENILQSFESTVEPIFNKIASCIHTIEISQQARDRLLPKLMSGELEV